MPISSDSLFRSLDAISFQLNYIADKDLASSLSLECIAIGNLLNCSEEHAEELSEAVNKFKDSTPRIMQKEIHLAITKEIDFIANTKMRRD